MAIAGTLGGVALLVWLVGRRRRALEDLDMLTSWDAFRAPDDRSPKEVPELEGNAMDGTDEVQAALDDLL